MGEIIACAALAVFIYLTVIFAAALAVRDNSIVDIAWGPGFVLVALLTLLIGEGKGPRPVVATLLVAIWGLRLGAYIFLRKRGHGEDFRYAKWRRDWRRGFVLRSYFQIFLLQGAFLIVIASGVMLVNASSPPTFGPLDLVGAALWAVGFFFEAVGDAQLARFKKNPASKGRIMTSGLWRLTRHPNYFGEVAMWWGLFLIALSVPGGWGAVASPLLMTFLLLRVSGVTMLEKKYQGNREFAEYASRTSAFFPLPPKRKKTA